MLTTSNPLRQSRIRDINYKDDNESSESTSSCESESSTDSESQVEPVPRDKRFSKRLSKRLSMHLNDTISLADLQGLLQEQCPGEYAAMLRRSALTFEDWKDSKRLRIGGIRTPFDLTSKNVYAYVEGNNHNGVRLIQGPASKRFPLAESYIIELDQPFQDLCENGRLFYPEEKARLRAAICFWFLEAGHVQTMKRYRDFEKHLIDGCQWLGGAVLREADQDGGSDLDKTPHAKSVLQPVRASHRPSSSYKRRRSTSDIELDPESVLYSKFFHVHIFVVIYLTVIQRPANGENWRILHVTICLQISTKTY